ncbi:hypothetical protein [Haloarcula amylovorans]|uniref:hypothetical protein n=1 Tax=Haloarcula amylovorans TaxID=2562280 RepID=UPI001075DA8D|nr:hypothetical protein [Halomicroarcula amylolytica]
MRRRRVLQTACAAVSSISGCGGLVADSESRDSTASPASKSVSAYPCPPDGSGRDGYVCSHTVDTDAASVYLLPSEPVTTAPPSDVLLTLHNDSSTELTLNPFQWTIRRQTTSEWEAVEQQSSGNGRLALSPGETHSWTLSGVVNFVNREATLETGTYTAAIDIPGPGGAEWKRCLALLRLE